MYVIAHAYERLRRILRQKFPSAHDGTSKKALMGLIFFGTYLLSCWAQLSGDGEDAVIFVKLSIEIATTNGTLAPLQHCPPSNAFVVASVSEDGQGFRRRGFFESKHNFQGWTGAHEFRFIY